MIDGNLFAAIRGPIMLITIGTLFALDHQGIMGFDRTWPLLIVVFGVMKLLERVAGGTQPYPPYPPPPPPYAGTNAGTGAQR